MERLVTSYHCVNVINDRLFVVHGIIIVATVSYHNIQSHDERTTIRHVVME